MIATLQSANLMLRFVLEIVLLAIAAFVGWRSFDRTWLRVAAAVAAPLAVGVLWATVVHGAHVPPAVRLGTQIVLFGLAVTALARLGRRRLAAGFAIVVVSNALLMTAWAQ
jgi:Protein of unknown function (DUF2568)